MSLLVKGVTNFLGLTDTPASYAAQQKKVAKVNVAENALEFGQPPLGFVNFYSGALPTDFPWGYEPALPFTFTTSVYWSPIMLDAIGRKIVYLIDMAQEFWKYNLETQLYTKLASPNYTGVYCMRELHLSPNGLRLACTSEQYPAADGGRRISIYNTVSDTWTDSSQVPQVTYDILRDAYARSLVWEDDDTIWTWVKAAAGAHRFKCMKYTPSTDTFTEFVNYMTSSYGTGDPAAIKLDHTVVYAGRCGGSLQNYTTYTIATDTYATPGSIPAGRQFVNVADENENNLWYVFSSTPHRPGYLEVEGLTTHDNQFPANNEETSFYGSYGIKNYSTCIYKVKAAEPSIMTYQGTGMWRLAQQTLTQKALIMVDKPVDGYAVIATEPTLKRTLTFYTFGSVAVPAGTWSFYYPKDGDYTQITLYYSYLEGG